MMESKRSVAIAIDGSDNSSIAFDFYVENVRKPGDHVVLIHVTEYNSVIKECSLLADPDIITELLRDTEEKTKELINIYSIKMKDLQELRIHFHTMARYASIHYIKIEGHVRQQCGQPGEAIIEAIKDEGAALLIIGSRGRGFFRRTFLGSVSDYCLHHACVPVLICRHKTSLHCKEQMKE